MNKLWGVVLLLLLCLLFSACSSDDKNSSVSSSSSSPLSSAGVTSTPQPQMAKIVVINSVDGGLNIRASAPDGNILTVAESGDKFRLLVDDPDDGWYQIQYGSGKAYVHSDYVTVQTVTLEEANSLNSSSSSESSSSSASGSESSASQSSAPASSSEPDNSMDVREDGQA